MARDLCKGGGVSAPFLLSYEGFAVKELSQIGFLATAPFPFL